MCFARERFNPNRFRLWLTVLGQAVCQLRNGAMLKHVSQSQRISRLIGAGSDAINQERVAAELKNIVMNPHAPKAQYRSPNLGKLGFLRSPRCNILILCPVI